MEHSIVAKDNDLEGRGEILFNKLNNVVLADKIKQEFREGAEQLIGAELISVKEKIRYLLEMEQAIDTQVLLVLENRQKLRFLAEVIYKSKNLSEEQKKELGGEYSVLQQQSENYGVKITLKELSRNIHSFADKIMLNVFIHLDQILKQYPTQFNILKKDDLIISNHCLSMNFEALTLFSTDKSLLFKKEIQAFSHVKDNCFTVEEINSYAQAVDNFPDLTSKLLFITYVHLRHQAKIKDVEKLKREALQKLANNDYAQVAAKIEKLKKMLPEKCFRDWYGALPVKFSLVSWPIEKVELKQKKEKKLKEENNKEQKSNPLLEKLIISTLKKSLVVKVKIWRQSFAIKNALNLMGVFCFMEKQQQANHEVANDEKTASVEGKKRAFWEKKKGRGLHPSGFEEAEKSDLNLANQQFSKDGGQRINIDQHQRSSCLKNFKQELKTGGIKAQNVEISDKEGRMYTTVKGKKVVYQNWRELTHVFLEKTAHELGGDLLSKFGIWFDFELWRLQNFVFLKTAQWSLPEYLGDEDREVLRNYENY
jgi:hypothetical protein